MQPCSPPLGVGASCGRTRRNRFGLFQRAVERRASRRNLCIDWLAPSGGSNSHEDGAAQDGSLCPLWDKATPIIRENRARAETDSYTDIANKLRRIK